MINFAVFWIQEQLKKKMLLIKYHLYKMSYLFVVVFGFFFFVKSKHI